MTLSFKSSISGDLSRARYTLEACAVLCNKLKLNGDKTEMLIFHAKHRPASFFDQVQAARTSVTSSASSKNIGIVLDSTLRLTNTLRKFANLHFILLGTFRASESFKSPDSVDRCPRICYLKLDNCNSLLYGLSKNLLQRLQYICFEFCS